MPFNFKCQNCKTELEAQDEWLGMKTQCPSCQAEVTIEKDAPPEAVPVVESEQLQVDSNYTTQPKQKNQKMLYAIIGFSALVVIVIAVFFLSSGTSSKKNIELASKITGAFGVEFGEKFVGNVPPNPIPDFIEYDFKRDHEGRVYEIKANTEYIKDTVSHEKGIHEEQAAILGSVVKALGNKYGINSDEYKVKDKRSYNFDFGTKQIWVGHSSVSFSQSMGLPGYTLDGYKHYIYINYLDKTIEANFEKYKEQQKNNVELQKQQKQEKESGKYSGGL